MTDEMRVKIIAKYESGKSPKMISSELDIKYETVRSVINTFKKTGRKFAKKTRTPKIKKISPDIESLIKDKISLDCSITLKKLATSIAYEENMGVSKATIFRAIKNFNYTLKRVVLIPEIRNSERVIEQRYIYGNTYLLLSKEKILFLDKFGIIVLQDVAMEEVNAGPRKKASACYKI
jgi:transposase